MRRVLEICTDRLDDIALAVSSGADRIELCSALSLGGLTPSTGAMRLAAAAGVPVVALIRPREGTFVFSAAEARAMTDDIASARAAGMSGVAIGALTRDGQLDTAILEDFVEAAGSLPLTLHRAFDLTRDPFEALEKAIELGFARVLTSGQQESAPRGATLIASLIEQAAGRITVMPGAGIRPDTLAALLRTTGATEFHASCAIATEPKDTSGACLGFGAETRRLDPSQVRAMRRILEDLQETVT